MNMKVKAKNKIENFKTLISPIVSGKTTLLLQKNNKVVFRVNDRSNKNKIKKAFQDIFNVEVDSVNIERVKGKKKANSIKKTKDISFKKAIITIKKGQKIDLFE